MTFQLLLTSGHDVADALIKRLIDLYICDSAATDAISTRLRDVCPSLYSCGDELYSKVPRSSVLRNPSQIWLSLVVMHIYELYLYLLTSVL